MATKGSLHLRNQQTTSSAQNSGPELQSRPTSGSEDGSKSYPTNSRSETVWTKSEQPAEDERQYTRSVPEDATADELVYLAVAGEVHPSLYGATLRYGLCLAALSYATPMLPGWLAETATLFAVKGFPYHVSVAAYVIVILVNAISIATSHSKGRRQQLMQRGAIALLIGIAYAVYLFDSGMPAFILPWGARLVPSRMLTWIFTNPIVLARMSYNGDASGAPVMLHTAAAGSAPLPRTVLYDSAVFANTAMVVTGFASLVCCIASSWATAVILMALSNAFFAFLLSAQIGWLSAAHAAARRAKPEGGVSSFMLPLTSVASLVAWCVFPALQLAEVFLFSSVPHAWFEVAWSVADFEAKILWMLGLDDLVVRASLRTLERAQLAVVERASAAASFLAWLGESRTATLSEVGSEEMQ